MTILLALLTILVPASVALTGHWFSQQAQRRLASDRELDARRLAQHQAEERSRLRLDAAMRAGSLFGAAGEARPNSASSASGLLALTELGRADLAVALLVDLWSVDAASALDPGEVAPVHDPTSALGSQEVHQEAAGRLTDSGGQSSASSGRGAASAVSTETAVLVINAALSSSSAEGQLVAAELLCRNASRLDPCQSLHWPKSIDGGWLPTLPPRAKLLAVEALVRMTVKSVANENALRSIAVRLYGIWKSDSDTTVKGCIGTLIASLLPALRKLAYSDFMQGSELVALAELELAGSSAKPNPDGFLKRLVMERGEALEHWSEGCDTCDFSPGMLAAAVS